MLQRLVLFLLIPSLAFAQIEFSSKAEATAYYNACSTNLFQWVDRAGRCETSLWDLMCDEVIDWQVNQRGGLWKPISESTGRPTILLPEYYFDKTMVVMSPTGSVVAFGTLRGLTNGNRATFAIGLHASALPYESRVVVNTGSSVECRYVLDPSRRYE